MAAEPDAAKLWEQEELRNAANASVGGAGDIQRFRGAVGRPMLDGAIAEQSANDYFDTHEHEGNSQRAGKKRMRMPLSSGAEDPEESSLGILSSRVLLFDRNTNFTFRDSGLLSSSKISQKIGARQQEKAANQAFHRHLKDKNI